MGDHTVQAAVGNFGGVLGSREHMMPDPYRRTLFGEVSRSENEMPGALTLFRQEKLKLKPPDLINGNDVTRTGEAPHPDHLIQ